MRAVVAALLLFVAMRIAERRLVRWWKPQGVGLPAELIRRSS